MEHNEAYVIYKSSCPFCTSSDAFAVYSDGHGYCFSCRTHQASVEGETPRISKSQPMRAELIHGEYQALGKRGISEAICKKYGYHIGEDMAGNRCQAANYYDEHGMLVAQKLRYKDKTFKFIGEPKKATLFGQKLWGEGSKIITITEGEIDALSVAEAFGGKYPVVSIKNGAGSAKKELAQQLEWLNTFQEVYLWFDSDEPGRKALEECIPLFPAGKVKVIQHPEYKDASDVLTNEGISSVVSTFYKAKQFRPDGIVTVADLEDEVCKPVEYGLPWCFDGMTKLTYGRRKGEVHLLGAGVSIGKTDFIMNQVTYDITHGIKAGTFMLEQHVIETLKRVAGKIDGKHYHLPNDDDKLYDPKQLKKTVGVIKESDCLYLYDNFGSIDWEVIRDKIRFMAHNYGVQTFYIDNLTALTAHASDERRFIDGFMEEVVSLAQELQVWILVVSHLNPVKKGASHEEGGKVIPSQFTGSRAIMRWAFYMMGLERNTQAEALEDRSKVVLRFLKDRYSGSATGQTISLRYDPETGLMREVDEEWSDVEAQSYEGEDY